MPFQCPMAGGAFRGPPPPLILVPIVIQLVRSSCDPKMTAYLKEVSKGGPQAIAEHAHKIAQYALSKLPSGVLYWFASKVLALPPDTAMQTTAFLKSRSDLDILLGPDAPVLRAEGVAQTPLMDIETRLEKLALDYRWLQQSHEESVSALTHNPDERAMSRRLPLPGTPAAQQTETITDGESMQLISLDLLSQSPQSEAASTAALQDVGLRLGRVFLEWAGDTMKQTLVTAASKSSASPALVGAGVDLATRLVDAVVA